MPPREEDYDEGDDIYYLKDYDGGGEKGEKDIMIIASMARCLITTRVRHTPRSLLEPET